MKERPILFSGPMVRALLDGSKTQTRRVVKFDDPAPQGSPTLMDNEEPVYWAWGADHYICPYGDPGDRLWVKETWKPCFGDGSGTSFAADPAHDPVGKRGPWKPSIFMTRKRSRIDLEITAVRVERLQVISDADAIAEGVEKINGDAPCPVWRNYLFKSSMPKRGEKIVDEFHRILGYASPVKSYRSLWESINGTFSYTANPWVWVLEFRRVK